MSGADREPIRLVQITDDAVRRVALVDEPDLRLLESVASVRDLALQAAETDRPLANLALDAATGDRIQYDAVYEGASRWRLLPPIDHPDDPARCLVSGTGLTHVGSARDRDAMHESQPQAATDSLRMFLAGLEGGRPAPGTVGVAPEWFYKGTGTALRAHGEPLIVPGFAEDGGEEAEIAGVYLVDARGRPRRIGMAIGNEFSDHAYERRNYLHLAASKLRTCSLGPEIVVNPRFDTVAGEVSIARGGRTIWSRSIATGENAMCHSLANIEHHHFKFDAHRRPGDVHVHFFGAHSLSFGDGIALQDGDIVTIRFEGFGRPLTNVVRVETGRDVPVEVLPL
ncbi:MAG TPA: AraD1 family protein [Vicinamibacterales bacterium]|nr:AraD1 family protein [Vicinamibacterales bacterium]